jgi:hypothetical protein
MEINTGVAVSPGSYTMHRRDTDGSPPDEWIYISTPPYVFMGWCLIMDRKFFYRDICNDCSPSNVLLQAHAETT